MKSEKIGYVEAVALLVIVLINKVILVLPKEIIANTGSAAWINVLYLSILAVLLAWFISHLFKKFQGYDILDACEFVGGPSLKTVVGVLYIFLLMLVPIFVLKNSAETLKIIYFRKSPLIFILLFFLVGSTLANRLSLKVLTKVNLLLMPLTFLAIPVILIASAKDFSFRSIFPILGYGVNETFFSSFTNFSSFSGIGYLFLLNPFLEKPDKFKKISIVSTIICGIYLFFTVTCILLSLSYSFKTGESFSLYLLTRNLDYGRFLRRIDAVFILIWIISIIIYISLAIYFSIYIFQKITKISDTSSINYTFNLLALAVLLIPVSLVTFLNTVSIIFRYASITVLFIISGLIMIWANLKLKHINKMKGKT